MAKNALFANRVGVLATMHQKETISELRKNKVPMKKAIQNQLGD